jgi:peptidoglycan/LPS O-acetylase OafA/YrhL
VAADGAVAARQPQGFNLLRIAAASLVLVGHSYRLTTGGWGPDAIVFGDNSYGLARLSVIAFFIISGYLVCGSWLATPAAGRFAAKRARRLYPGLLAMVLLVGLVMGPLVTTADRYFARAATWSFIGRNALVFPYDYLLPGVFTHNPLHDVNGVLWTLGVEVLAYILLGIAGRLGFLSRPLVLAVLAASLAFFGWDPVAKHLFGEHAASIGIRVELLGYFFAAATVRAYGWRVSWQVAAAATAAVAATMALRAPTSILLVPAATAIVLYIGTRSWPAARRITHLGDPSYGMYIYGFVVQQLLIAYGMRDAPLAWFMTASLGISLGVGYVSWHLVEKRFLRSSTKALPPPWPADVPSRLA